MPSFCRVWYYHPYILLHPMILDWYYNTLQHYMDCTLSCNTGAKYLNCIHFWAITTTSSYAELHLTITLQYKIGGPLKAKCEGYKCIKEFAKNSVVKKLYNTELRAISNNSLVGFHKQLSMHNDTTIHICIKRLFTSYADSLFYIGILMYTTHHHCH